MPNDDGFTGVDRRIVMEGRYIPKGWRTALWHRAGGSKFLRRVIEENAAGIAGHTILAAYRKG